MMLQVSHRLRWKWKGGRWEKKKKEAFTADLPMQLTLFSLQTPTADTFASCLGKMKGLRFFTLEKSLRCLIKETRPDLCRRGWTQKYFPRVTEPAALRFCPQACTSRRSRLLGEKSPPSFGNSTDVNSNYRHCGRLNLWRPPEVTATVLAGCYFDILDWKSNSLKFKMLAFNQVYSFFEMICIIIINIITSLPLCAVWQCYKPTYIPVVGRPIGREALTLREWCVNASE